MTARPPTWTPRMDWASAAWPVVPRQEGASSASAADGNAARANAARRARRVLTCLPYGLSGGCRQEFRYGGVERLRALPHDAVSLALDDRQLRSGDQGSKLGRLPDRNHQVALGPDDVDRHRQLAQAVADVVVGAGVCLAREGLRRLGVRVLEQGVAHELVHRVVLEERFGVTEVKQVVDLVRDRQVAGVRAEQMPTQPAGLLHASVGYRQGQGPNPL